jgi:methylated-DNA-protein-cysteine methyltransferase-like protein
MKNQFSQRVWELATSIPPGHVTTYGILAKAAGGGAMAARSITSILSKAPNQGAIPYHRIVYAGGKIWFTPEREEQRRELYANENIEVNGQGVIQNLDEVLYYFN